MYVQSSGISHSIQPDRELNVSANAFVANSTKEQRTNLGHIGWNTLAYTVTRTCIPAHAEIYTVSVFSASQTLT